MNSPAIHWADDGSNRAVADHLARVVQQNPNAVIAVPGGSTPLPIFEELRARGIDWSSATLMLTDDRIVPPGHPASNQSKLQSAFCGSGARIVALEEGAVVPDLDLVWLGMGADGHIASLFPAMACADLPGSRIVRTEPNPLPPEAPFPRLSMNMEALASASAEIILVIRGDVKKRVLEDAVAGSSDVPANSLLRRADCPITIYWSAE